MATHRVPPAVPGVEVAHDAHAAGVRGPHGEDHARHAVEDGRVGAELLVGLVVRPLAEEEAVEVRQGRREPVGVLDLPDAPGSVGHREAIPEERRAPGKRRLEDPVRMQALHLARRDAGLPRADLGPERPGKERADRDRRLPALAADVRTQDGERIRMPPRHQSLHVRDRQGAANRRRAHMLDCTRAGAARARVYYLRWATGRSCWARTCWSSASSLAYWWRVESGIRTLERETGSRPAGGRP